MQVTSYKDCGKSDGRYHWKKQRPYAIAIAWEEGSSAQNFPFRWNKETDKQ